MLSECRGKEINEINFRFVWSDKNALKNLHRRAD